MAKGNNFQIPASYSTFYERRFIGESRSAALYWREEDMPLPRYIPMQVFAIAIALFKLSITWERKFKRGEKWWAEFYLRVKLGKSSICEILKICLTSPHNLLALCTYTASMFFFLEKGAIDQILKITCRISTACEHDFNALNPPPLSGCKLPVAYSLTAMSTITLIFTQIITDIDRYLQNQNAASGFCEKVTRLFQCLCRRDQNRETNPKPSWRTSHQTQGRLLRNISRSG